jgi:hypothetical protein
MHFDKYALERMEERIGNGCIVTVSATDFPGVKLTARWVTLANEPSRFFSREYGVLELHNLRTPKALLDAFADSAIVEFGSDG